MRKKKYKPKFAVLCRLVDCEDDFGLFLYEGDRPMTFDTSGAARVAMKRDYRMFAESYDAKWSVDGKDHCKKIVRPDEILIDVPIWDGENQRESWIHARWKIVSL